MIAEDRRNINKYIVLVVMSFIFITQIVNVNFVYAEGIKNEMVEIGMPENSKPGEMPDKITFGNDELNYLDVKVMNNGNLVIEPVYINTVADGVHTIKIINGNETAITDVIVENGIVTGSIAITDSWSLINLIITVILLISPIIFIIANKKHTNTECHQYRDNYVFNLRRKRTLVTIGILGIVGGAIFFLRESFLGPMEIFNENSLQFVILLLAQIIIEVIYSNKKNVKKVVFTN